MARSAEYILLYTNFILICCFAEDVYIRSSENVTCQFMPCLTLNEFASLNPNPYITESDSNAGVSFILFSSGNHHLNKRLQLVDVSNLVLTGNNETHDSTVLMIRGTSATMWLEDSNMITVANLVFKTANGLPAIDFYRTTGILSWIAVLGYNIQEPQL